MKKKGKGLLCLMIAGAALIAFALASLYSMEPVLEYALPAAQAIGSGDGETDESAPLRRLAEARDDALKELTGCVSSCAVGGVKSGESVSFEGNSANATLYAVGKGWFETYPQYLSEGRLIGADEQEEGARVIVLDAEMAFKLFGPEEAIGRTVSLEGEEFEVVGLIRHRRSVGEMDEYTVFIPFLSAQNVALETVLLGARPVPHSGAAVLFENVMTNSFVPGGCFYNIEKEVMRATMILRLFALVAGMYWLMRLLSWMNGVVERLIERFRERLAQQYMTRLIGRLALDVALCLIAYAAWIGLVYLLLNVSIQPLYQFTEWIPENLVEWKAWKNVFWNLMRAQDRLVSVSTCTLAEVRFYGLLTRWGAVALLFGWAVPALGRSMRKPKESRPAEASLREESAPWMR